MNEASLVQKILGRLELEPEITRALCALARTLEEARLAPGLVLWAWDLLGVCQLTVSEKLTVVAHLLALFLAEGRGHTTLDPEGPELAEIARRLREATEDGPFTAPRLAAEFRRFLENRSLVALLGDGAPDPAAPDSLKPGWAAPLVFCDGQLQFSRTRWMERECARLLRERFGTVDEAADRTDPFAGFAGELDDVQRRMIRQVPGKRVFWISGGPGTGKTSCIYGLLWAMGRWSPGLDAGRIAIAAPTGKAGFRITQSLRRMAAAGGDPGKDTGPGDAVGPYDAAILDGRLDASTLHRLLDYRPGTDRFGRHEGSPLELDWVIVDESSMVDLVLCHALLRALPATAGLIWIGDRDQLPAVGRGALFQASWEQGPARYPDHYFRLERNYRAEQGLAGDIHRVMDRGEKTWEGPVAGFPAQNRLVLHRTETARQWHELLDQVFSRTFDRSYWDAALDAFEWDPSQIAVDPGGHPRYPEIVELLRRAGSAPVLCVTHAGSRGTVAVNEYFHRKHPWGTFGLLPGEPVMVQVNDYQRSLWNGDFGVVLHATWQGEKLPCVAFLQGDQLRIFPLAGLPLARAFAFSVHKSQGSEFPEVTLALPEVPSLMLTRELIYTAITRGRSCVRIAGTPPILQAGLSTTVERRMNLARWLFGDQAKCRQPP
ncbi:AAA family ATPase [Myxococcota bacterium]|nr:AAA family ATPase [Myxococcota bacterium]